MTDESRHHHYIPQAYLKGFARKGSERQWYTHVTDLSAQRTYTANIRNVCGERDFLRIDLEEYPPDALEKEMSTFESKCISAIRRVADSGRFEGDDANLTLNLMALLAVRSPEMRESIRGFHEQVAKRLMDISLSSKSRWEKQTSRIYEGRMAENHISYERIKNFHDKGQYKVALAREYHIRKEFKMMESVLHALGKRLWTIYTTDASKGEFLTTNRPVTLTYIAPEKVPHFYRRSPGFGLTNTEVYFPLTRHAILVGRFDRGGHTKVAQESFIAATNMHMMSHCYGKAFSAQSELLYLDPHSQTVNRDGMLLERVRLWREQTKAAD